MYKLRVVQSGKQYDYEPGASLLEILLAQNIFIDNPCNEYAESVKYASYQEK